MNRQIVRKAGPRSSGDFDPPTISRAYCQWPSKGPAATMEPMRADDPESHLGRMGSSKKPFAAPFPLFVRRKSRFAPHLCPICLPLVPPSPSFTASPFHRSTFSPLTWLPYRCFEDCLSMDPRHSLARSHPRKTVTFAKKKSTLKNAMPGTALNLMLIALRVRLIARCRAKYPDLPTPFRRFGTRERGGSFGVDYKHLAYQT